MSIVPPETQDEIVRLYINEQLSCRQIAGRVFWSLNAVLRVLHERNVTIVPNRQARRLSDDDLARTVELYTSGLSQDEIAAALGIARDTVKYRLLRAGVRLRSRTDMNVLRRRKRLASGGPRAFTARQQRVVDALKQNGWMSTPQIADAVDAAPHPVRQTLRQLRRLGVVEYKPTHSGRAHPYAWTLTDAKPGDELARVLAPQKTGGSRENDLNMLPIQPLRDWIDRQVAEHNRVARLHSGDNWMGAFDAVAKDLGITERRLWAIRNGQPRISLALADRILTQSSRPERLEDLWPHLADDMEVAA